VHGKGAHPADTWSTLINPSRDPRNPASFVNWLDNEEMLPAVLPNARVLRYGYLSEWFGENALRTRAASIGARLLDELESMRLEATDRPLILVGHSFGGLVIVKVSSRHSS
jgi:pimeloyl-ACP methyl ester carboxylesterase